MPDHRLPPATQIGLAHLRVSDLPRAQSFYCDRVGFREMRRDGATAILSASGSAPAHLVLEAAPNARPKPPRTTGLYHVAIRLPTRAALAAVIRRLAASGWRFQGAADHGVSEAFYLADPDGNGLELYADRPREQWTWDGDQVAMFTEPLDVEGLLAEAPGADDGLIDLGRLCLDVSKDGLLFFNWRLAEKYSNELFPRQMGNADPIDNGLESSFAAECRELIQEEQR